MPTDLARLNRHKDILDEINESKFPVISWLA